ncbi:MAG: TonB-dependent receptor, partial [Acidobacteriota bacterium]
SRTLQANSNGDYEAVNTKAGRYRIEVNATGFQTFSVKEVVLAARQALRVDATLSAGQVIEQVDVSTNAGAIATETQTIASTFEAQKIINLPANYRASGSTSPYILIASLPGVQADNSNNFSIQGALPSQSQFSLDGISTTNVRGNAPLTQAFPSAESIAEIKVQGVGNAAEYGQVGDVTTISKSGTNDYHATIFWFHQNRAFDSNAYGALTKPKKIGNDFGASGGGPVRLPSKVFGPVAYEGRDKTFFFGTFEGFRFPRGQTVQNTVPTQAMRTGDFSAEPNVTVRDPLTGLPFQNNKIPDSRISPIAKQFLTLYPLPNTGATDRLRVANYIRNSSSSLDSKQYDIRIDHYLTKNQSVFGRWTSKNVSVDSPNILALPSSTNSDRYRILVVSHNYTITPHLLNEARFGMTLNDTVTAFPFNGIGFTNGLGFQGIGPNFPFNGLPNVSFSGDVTDLNRGRGDSISQSRTFQFNDNVTWTKGRHTMKYGFDVRGIRAVTALGFIGADNYGNSDFDGTFSGSDFGDFLLGIPIRTSFAIIQQDNDGRTRHYHFYGQDSFRVNQKLTLEFGLRYEYHPAYTDASGNIGNFDTSVARSGRVVYPTGKESLLAPGFLKTFNACPAPAANGANCTPVNSATEAGLPEGLRRVPKLRFLPRFGFAYRLGDEKTVIRGGIGAYNGTLLGNTFFSLTGTLQSDVREFTNLTPQGKAIFQWPAIQTGGTGISTGSLGTASFRTANDIDYKDPYSLQWNLSIDRYVGFGLGVRVSYIGMKTTQLAWAPDLNQMTSSRTFAINRPLSDRPFPNWGIIFTRTAGASAFYNALQVEANRRFSRGLTFNSTYTWAKNINDNGGPNSTGFTGETGGGRAADLYNRRAERGNDYATRRHRSITTIVYDLPVGRGQRFAGSAHPAANAVIGGWQVSAIFLAQTGPFLTPSVGSVDPSGSGSGLSRTQHPDRIGDGNIDDPTWFRWFDTSAFVCPGLSTRVASQCRIGVNPALDAAPIGRFGTAGVGIIRGPGTINLSLGLTKSFRLTERVKLDAGGSFTNVTNHTNFADPNMTVTSSAFGRITTARASELGGSRTGQVSMRLSF